MISYLKGKVVETSYETVSIDVNGVGYELTCSLTTLVEFSGRSDVQAWVQTYLREDAISLFGFATQLEKQMFLALVKVNGVGPKMAIKILSGASIATLVGMIESGDAKALSTLPKVGKKTAEQIVLSLKGKLGEFMTVSGSLATGGGGNVDFSTRKRPLAAPSSAQALAARWTGPRAEVLSALVNLGFRAVDAEQVVTGLAEDVEFEAGLREGLQALSGAL